MIDKNSIKGRMGWHRDEILAISKRLEEIRDGRVNPEELLTLARFSELVVERIEETEIMMLQAIDGKQKEK